MANDSMRYTVRRTINQAQERRTNFDLPLSEFARAYDDLRRTCPVGDIHICLSIETEYPKCVRCQRHDQGEMRPAIGNTPGHYICYRCLPAQWNCPRCGYGEYKVREDWERRRTEHVNECGGSLLDRVSTARDMCWDYASRSQSNECGAVKLYDAVSELMQFLVSGR